MNGLFHLLRCARAALTFLLALTPYPVVANPIYCTGTVANVYVSDAGDVIFQASYRNDYTEVCNVHGTWQGISSETCFTWFSALLAAKVHSKQVLLQYSTSTYSCSTLPTYGSALRPSYVMVTG